MTTPTITIEIPLVSSLITLNQRIHWSQRAKATRAIRDEVIWRTRQIGIGALERPTVTLHVVPAVRRRRDVDNLVPTSKAALDGLVTAGVIDDDTPDYVDHRMPVIHDPEPVARVYVEVTA